MRTKLLFFFGCFYCVFAFGQLDTYDYKIELSGIEDQWHKIELPVSVFEKVSQNMNDLRIYGITTTDTLEAPYLLKVHTGKQLLKTIDFKTLNETSNSSGYYYTYEIPTSEAINNIHLDFKNENFDWKIVLEGSQNQNEWFTILDDYRILSIKNSQTDYTFTDLNFSNAKYRFYRLLIKTGENPNLEKAKINIEADVSPIYKKYPVQEMTTATEMADKEQISIITLKKRVPVSYLKINVEDEIEYYRPITIEYQIDSVKTDFGWRGIFRTLTSGTLNSIEKNEFRFPSTLTQKIRVTVRNYDNQPLTFKDASAKGYAHEMVARFTKPATYYLAFGKPNARKPQYDISQAVSKIPTSLSKLTLGKVQNIPKKEAQTTAPLFENKLWLWLVMGLVIVVLGGFTFKMMQKK